MSILSPLLGGLVLYVPLHLIMLDNLVYILTNGTQQWTFVRDSGEHYALDIFCNRREFKDADECRAFCEMYRNMGWYSVPNL